VHEGANRQRTTCVPGGKSVRSCHPGRRRSGCRPPSSGRNALSLSSCVAFKVGFKEPEHRPLSAFGSSGGSQMTVSTDGKLFLVLVRVFSGIADLKWMRLPRPTTQNKCQENAYKEQKAQYVGCTGATVGHSCGLCGSQKIRVNFRHRCLRRMTLPRHLHSSSHQCTVPQAP
jgi:hypothetical protein